MDEVFGWIILGCGLLITSVLVCEINKNTIEIEELKEAKVQLEERQQLRKEITQDIVRMLTQGR